MTTPERPPRYYVYKCVVDDGGAPCVFRGLYSLSICKPAIRRRARPGDLIFAFGSNNGEQPPNRLVYIAVVESKVLGGQYYQQPEYADRPDCIYRRAGNGRLVRREDARFHAAADHRTTDLGRFSRYTNAVTLLSGEFRYFGNQGTDEWKQWAPTLADLIENLGQGHRVKLNDSLRQELRLLKERIWKRYPTKKVLGKPLHGLGMSETGESDEVVECGGRCRYLPKRRPKSRNPRQRSC